jgi:hypothetical protein
MSILISPVFFLTKTSTMKEKRPCAAIIKEKIRIMRKRTLVFF